MGLKALHAHSFYQCISVLQSGFGVIDLHDPLIQGVSDDAMFSVDMTRPPAAEPDIGHLDDPLFVLVYRHFAR